MLSSKQISTELVCKVGHLFGTVIEILSFRILAMSVWCCALSRPF